MDFTEARACLERGEPDVLYRPVRGEPEQGVITSVSGRFARVRFDGDEVTIATDPADLEALTPDQARRRRFRSGLRSVTGGDDG